ncbi:MAG: response regulator [Gammaproteobacteria bacterium]|nr:response regulator [Gammaproteobacteria bacterium]
MPGNTVYIVDDDASVRDSLALLLSLRGYASLVFASADDFLNALQPDWSGCVVVDIRMPGMSGLELLERLQQRAPKLPGIVITAHGDVAAARRAFLAEALDFVEKPFDGEQLVATIERALMRVPTEPEGRATHRASLTEREREVMLMLVKGLNNRRIAEELGISPRTVEAHRARLLGKTGADNIVELVRLSDQGKI